MKEDEISHRLVIGPGASGRSHRLRTWVAELDAAVKPVWFVARPGGRSDEAAVKDALAEAEGAVPPLLIVDDLQWVAEDGLQRLADAGRRVHIWASRRPWPTGPTLRAINDLITEQRGAERTGALAADHFATAIGTLANAATSSELVDNWYGAAGGLVGLGADCLASNWDGDLASIPEELIDAVSGRIDRAGPLARSLVELMAVGTHLDAESVQSALASGIRSSDAEREARAGGLVDTEGQLVPLVRAVLIADLTVSERAALHDRLATALAPRRPDLAVEHILAGTGEIEGGTAVVSSAIEGLAVTDPEQAIVLVETAISRGVPADDLAIARAIAAFNLGSLDALAHVEAVPSSIVDDRIGHLGFALEIRDLRLKSAVQREVAGPIAQGYRALARAMIEPPAAFTPADSESPHQAMVSRLVEGLSASSQGDAPRALGHYTAAADDHDRLKPQPSFGMTPHAVGALGALLAGDVAGADLLLTQAVQRESGGAGEEITHRLLLAYARSVDGQFHDALAAVREGDDDNWAQRDRLLLAVLDVALARRSGDTARLRDAWRRADPVLARQTTGWILIDPLTEILAAGARIGDKQRIDPIIESLVAAADALPADGPGPTAALWLRLQVALSREDSAGVRHASEQLAALNPVGNRAKARVAAAAVWAGLLDGQVDEAQVNNVADQFVAVGDKWEASRLLGQAALDHDDPKAARRLLEAARSLMSEAVEHTEDGLANLGLSEREVEVTRLVAEGRTYKEIGAQLYISPKTVEHHVARIRQKLGATSRAEFLAIVREAVGTPQ